MIWCQWWKTSHNIKVFRNAHVFRPGEAALIKGYCINDHPDKWCSAKGYFHVLNWSRCYVVDVTRQGCPDEFVKIVLTDERGQVTSGWMGRWTLQPGNCKALESIKYLGEEHVIAAEQGSDH